MNLQLEQNAVRDHSLICVALTEPAHRGWRMLFRDGLTHKAGRLVPASAGASYGGDVFHVALRGSSCLLLALRSRASDSLHTRTGLEGVEPS